MDKVGYFIPLRKHLHAAIMSMKALLQVLFTGITVLTFSACSLRLSSVFIEYKMETLNRETDLKKVQTLMPESIAQLESMLASDRRNKDLHIYAARAYYSYAFSFIEDRDKKQASVLYYQAYKHATAALASHGISAIDLQGRSLQLKQKIGQLPKYAVDALYWTAVSWAKLIEIQQPNPLLFIQLHKSVLLMEQVIKLDDAYYLSSGYLFLAVYYAGLPVYLGGNDFLARQYFEHVRSLNNNRLLMIDFLQAKYLNGRNKGKAVLKRRLKNIIKAPADLYPEQALMNAVARQKAEELLKHYQ